MDKSTPEQDANDKFANAAGDVAMAVLNLLVGASLVRQNAAVCAGAISGVTAYLAQAMSKANLEAARDFTIKSFIDALDRDIADMTDPEKGPQLEKELNEMRAEAASVILAASLAKGLKKNPDATVH